MALQVVLVSYPAYFSLRQSNSSAENATSILLQVGCAACARTSPTRSLEPCLAAQSTVALPGAWQHARSPAGCQMLGGLGAA